MILAAGLLVLLGLGFFLAGVLTGTTVFYWVCVVVCVLAAVLLFLARRRITQAEAAMAPTRSGTSPAGTSPAGTSPVGTTSAAPPSSGTSADVAPAEAEADAAPAATPSSFGPDADDAPAPAPEQRVRAHHQPGPHAPGAAPLTPSPQQLHDPPIEDVEVTDLLLVVDLKDEVFVVDEHPRYHLQSCLFLVGRTAIPLPMDEARVDGFTPCALCTPDRHLADRERARKRAGGS